jgi:hypothetical protein
MGLVEQSESAALGFFLRLDVLVCAEGFAVAQNGTNADGKISTENHRFEDPIRLS